MSHSIHPSFLALNAKRNAALSQFWQYWYFKAPLAHRIIQTIPIDEVMLEDVMYQRDQPFGSQRIYFFILNDACSDCKRQGFNFCSNRTELFGEYCAAFGCIGCHARYRNEHIKSYFDMMAFTHFIVGGCLVEHVFPLFNRRVLDYPTDGYCSDYAQVIDQVIEFVSVYAAFSRWDPAHELKRHMALEPLYSLNQRRSVMNMLSARCAIDMEYQFELWYIVGLCVFYPQHVSDLKMKRNTAAAIETNRCDCILIRCYRLTLYTRLDIKRLKNDFRYLVGTYGQTLGIPYNSYTYIDKTLQKTKDWSDGKYRYCSRPPWASKHTVRLFRSPDWKPVAILYVSMSDAFLDGYLRECTTCNSNQEEGREIRNLYSKLRDIPSNLVAELFLKVLRRSGDLEIQVSDTHALGYLRRHGLLRFRDPAEQDVSEF